MWPGGRHPGGSADQHQLADLKLAQALADLAALVLIVDHSQGQDPVPDPVISCCPIGEIKKLAVSTDAASTGPRAQDR
ncbi:hypothetical protein RFN58_35365 [Streptomyces iakyrus]|uniref:hypothetical protein n=1 Tax=Streptomyces iakyrus TaxID=68219 RepID=UPI0005270984|nr:hypothetical protein [Streptomyces iakyrus]